MKNLVVDSSSLISLSSNCLLWVIDKLRKRNDLQLVMTPEIKKEVVDKALSNERFRLGGVRVLKRLCNGSIIISESNPTKTKRLLESANKVYSVNDNYYKIIHRGEMSLVSLAQDNNTNLVLTDERIVEKLINNPKGLKRVFERRLHTDVKLNKEELKRFQSLIGDVNVLKSADLFAIAFEKGLLNDYVSDCSSKKTIKDFVSGSLWGLKDSGCAISSYDINEYLRILKV